MLSPSKSEPIAARVVVLCAAYALCVLLQRTAETTTLSLFVQQLGASKLPMSYLAMSLFDVPMAFGYMRLARTANRRSLLSGMAATLVAVLGAAYVLEPVHPGAGLFVGYLAASTIGTFLAIHWGVLLLDAFTVEESRRAFPLVYAGGHAGSFASGAVLQQLAGPVPSATLMVAVPAAALVMLAALLALVGRMREGAAVREGEVPRPGSAAGASAWGSIRMLRSSKLLQVLALATSLMVLLRLALRWLYGTSFEQSFSSPDELTRFLGGYTMIASVVGVALQLLVTPHLLRRLGVGRLNVAYGLAMLGSFAALAGAPGTFSAAAGRFTDMELKTAIKTPLSAMFYDAVGEHQRAEARAIVLGIVSPLTSVAGSVALVWVAARPAWTATAAWVCVLAGSGYVLLSAWQARVYRRTLQQRLVQWAGERTPGVKPTLEEAIGAALESGDGRMAGMAREVRWREPT